MSSHCNRYPRGSLHALCLGLVAAAMLLTATGSALAEPSREQKQAAALALYKKARIQYDLGNFEQAIEYFKEAYETSPHESFLFNIAQSYRQMDDCKNAMFFYKRYLSVAGADGKNSDLVRHYLDELNKRCKDTEDPANQTIPDRSPQGTGAGGSGRGGSGGQGSNAPGNMQGGQGSAGGTGTRPGGGGISASGRGAPQRASLLASSIELGPAFLDIGDLDITGAQFSLGVGAGYPLDLGSFGLSLGGLFTYTPVPWTNQTTAATGTASLTSLLFNVGARYWPLDWLAVRGEIGAGALFLGGLEEGNVFLPPETRATGTLSMFNLRFGIGAELMLTRNLVLSASPAVYSHSEAKQGLRPEIDGFTRFEIMAGLGYRL